MKNKVYNYGVLTALFCAFVVSSDFAVFAQYNDQEHDLQSQCDGTLGANMERPFHQLMHSAMTVMDNAIKGATMTGNPDRDFAAMMIPHHQGAVDMAKAELLYGKDPVLRRLAGEIIVTQEQEMEVMRMRLKQFRTQ